MKGSRLRGLCGEYLMQVYRQHAAFKNPRGLGCCLASQKSTVNHGAKSFGMGRLGKKKKGGGGKTHVGKKKKTTHTQKLARLNKSIMVLFQYEVEDFSLSLFAVFLTFLTFSSHALIPSSKTGREARDVRYKTA